MISKIALNMTKRPQLSIKVQDPKIKCNFLKAIEKAPISTKNCGYFHQYKISNICDSEQINKYLFIYLPDYLKYLLISERKISLLLRSTSLIVFPHCKH